MSSVNKVILLGSLGKDPEVRTTRSGTKIINLTLATSEKWRDKQSGEMKERVEWHRVVIFNDRICDFVEKYAQKGTKLYVEGKLATRKWTDQSGQDRYTTEINVDQFKGEVVIAAGGVSNDGGQQQRSSNNGGAGQRPSGQQGGGQQRGGGQSWDAPRGGEWYAVDLQDAIDDSIDMSVNAA